MVVTFRRLQGTRENLDITIFAHFVLQWNDANTQSITPLIECFTYTPDKTVETQNNLDPNRILVHIPERIHEEEEEDEPLGDCSHKWTTSIQIEVWSSEEDLLGLFEDEINRIIWENAPNSAIRLKKSDGNNPPLALSGQDSEAEYFVNSEIQFDAVDDDEEYPDRVGSQGTLKIVWFRDKS
jgi:hypothetical protein